MADTSTQSIQVHAPVDRVAAVISDFPRYPEWADAMKQVEEAFRSSNLAELLAEPSESKPLCNFPSEGLMPDKG